MARTTVSISVENDHIPRILAAFNYKATLPDGSDNPETALAYMKRMIREEVTNRVVSFEKQAAINAAVSNMPTPVDVT